MYAGDRSRKDSLVEYGFRLPSAYHNRPLNFKEFENKINQVIFVSATPSDYERQHSSQIVEQVIPCGPGNYRPPRERSEGGRPDWRYKRSYGKKSEVS